MRRPDGYLQPVLLQVLGVVLLIGFATYWIVSGQQSALLVGAALILIGMGSASGALISIRQEFKGPPPPEHDPYGQQPVGKEE